MASTETKAIWLEKILTFKQRNHQTMSFILINETLVSLEEYTVKIKSNITRMGIGAKK